jgi:hypothetical protein
LIRGFSPPCSPTVCRRSRPPALEALAEGVHSADVVLNILARRRDPGPAPPIHTPAALSLRHAPVADCAGSRHPEERLTMERSNILDMMAELKLFGMKAADARDARDRAQAPA